MSGLLLMLLERANKMTQTLTITNADGHSFEVDRSRVKWVFARAETDKKRACLAISFNDGDVQEVPDFTMADWQAGKPVAPTDHVSNDNWKSLSPDCFGIMRLGTETDRLLALSNAMASFGGTGLRLFTSGKTPEYPFRHHVIYADESPKHYEHTIFTGYLIEDNSPAAWKLADSIGKQVRENTGKPTDTYVAVIRKRPAKSSPPPKLSPVDKKFVDDFGALYAKYCEDTLNRTTLGDNAVNALVNGIS